MPNFNPDKLQTWTSGEWKSGVPSTISGFSCDTRTLQPSELFIAIKTENRDGHDFLVKAKNAGASGALVARFSPNLPLPQLLVKDPLDALHRMAAHHRQEFHGPVIGVTGSCGKTSTKELLALLLGDNQVHRNRENYNNQLGVPLTLLEIDPQNHDFAIIEAGMNAPGEIEPLSRMIDPTASIITMVSNTHLEAFDSIEAIAHEKAMLGRHTRTDGWVSFNNDCSQYRSFQDFPAISVILLPEDATETPIKKNNEYLYWSERRSTSRDGKSLLTLKVLPDVIHNFDLPTLSPGMVGNTSLSIATAWRLGINDTDIQERLSRWHPLSLRGEIIHREEKYFYVDCYNASPASMADSFNAFNSIMEPTLRRLYVLGCMAELGEASPDLHYEVGQLLKLRPEDKVLILGDYACEMREGIRLSGNENNEVSVLHSLDDIRDSVSEFKGAVLLKGSRIYKLEKLVPPPMAEESLEKREAC